MTDTDTALRDDEAERIRRWLDGDDSVSLASIFDDAAAYPDVSRALRAALAAASPPPLDVERLARELNAWDTPNDPQDPRYAPFEKGYITGRQQVVDDLRRTFGIVAIARAYAADSNADVTVALEPPTYYRCDGIWHVNCEHARAYAAEETP